MAIQRKPKEAVATAAAPTPAPVFMDTFAGAWNKPNVPGFIACQVRNDVEQVTLKAGEYFYLRANRNKKPGVNSPDYEVGVFPAKS